MSPEEHPVKRKKIFLTNPIGSGWVHSSVAGAVSQILSDRRFIVRHEVRHSRPYVNNLHQCMWGFLDGDYDYWLTMDDDNPPTKNPLDLVELDCDIIGCPTPVWANLKRGDRPWYYNAVDFDSEADAYRPHYPARGIQEVDAVGSGCLLIARRVIDALKDRRPFMRQWGPDGVTRRGGDFSFCEKAKQAGFRVFAHFGYPCEHHVEVPLLQAIFAFDAFYSRKERQP